MQIIYELSVGNERLEVGPLLCLNCMENGRSCYGTFPATCGAFLTDTASCKSALSCLAGMQRENAALRQHILDVRRASRKAGLDLNATSFLPIPVRLQTYAICCVLAVFC